MNIYDIRHSRAASRTHSAMDTDWKRHDERFHGGSYDPATMKCSLRDDLGRTDGVDDLGNPRSDSMDPDGPRRWKSFLSEIERLKGGRKVSPSDVEQMYGELQRISDKGEKRAAAWWLAKGSIRLPHDSGKVKDALSVARRARKDPLTYDSPMDLIADNRGFAPKRRPIDPDTVPELTNRTEMGHGVVVYDVDETIASPGDHGWTPKSEYDAAPYRGQLAMREIINTHWGEEANPWCLLQGDGHGNLSSDAVDYWDQYSSLQKKVAFRDGRLLAFMATDERGYDEYGFSDSFDDPFREEYPELAAEYDDWLESDEGQEEESTLHDWLEVNHPDVLDEYRSGASEKWWDRQDRDHYGIPLGNIPSPGDAFGRWGEYEIVDGRLVMKGGYHRGIRNSDDYVEWYSGGRKSVERTPGRRATWNPDGSLHSYSEPGDDGWAHGVNFTYGEGSEGGADVEVRTRNLFGHRIDLEIEGGVPKWITSPSRPDSEVDDQKRRRVVPDDEGGFSVEGEPRDGEQNMMLRSMLGLARSASDKFSELRQK